MFKARIKNLIKEYKEVGYLVSPERLDKDIPSFTGSNPLESDNSNFKSCCYILDNKYEILYENDYNRYCVMVTAELIEDYDFNYFSSVFKIIKIEELYADWEDEARERRIEYEKEQKKLAKVKMIISKKILRIILKEIQITGEAIGLLDFHFKHNIYSPDNVKFWYSDGLWFQYGYGRCWHDREAEPCSIENIIDHILNNRSDINGFEENRCLIERLVKQAENRKKMKQK